MKTRNTKQKELIIEILNHHRTHPTIEDIYQYAKEKDPSIGKATIYRNINRLVEEGNIIKLPNSNNESYHYDINISPHNHLLCKNCGKIYDIYYYDNNYNDIIKNITTQNPINIEKITILLEGLCEKCYKSNKILWEISHQYKYNRKEEILWN